MFKLFRNTTIVIAALLWAASASACNVPVFRYALERWHNDLYHVVVFHNADLSADDKQRVDAIGQRSSTEGGTANLEVTTVDLTEPLPPGLEALRKTIPEDAPLPFVLLQARMGREKTVTVWEGPLAETNLDSLTHSRDRQEIVDRLLKGHSAVWVVLPGQDELATHNTVNLIETELNRLQDELPLPEGIGQQGSEVYSEVPLTLRFSVLVLKPGPEADALLPGIFRRVEPAAAAEGQPLVAPVFGRGRAVDVIPGDKVDEATVEDLSRFISGACSCQVKEQNPGFDLLMSVPWNSRLFASTVQPPVDQPLKQQRPAELVSIAPGPAASPASAAPEASPPTETAATPLAESPPSPSVSQPKPNTPAPPAAAAPPAVELSWIGAWLLCAAIVVALSAWSLRPRRH